MNAGIAMFYIYAILMTCVLINTTYKTIKYGWLPGEKKYAVGAWSLNIATWAVCIAVHVQWLSQQQ